jgi:AcrR family transcriptional regulator
MTSPPSTQRADARRNRDVTIDVAMDLLARNPDASMRDIADAAALARTTLYRHFPAREDLIFAIFERIIAEARVITAEAVAEGGTAPEILRRLASEIVAIGARYKFLEAHRDLSERALKETTGEDEPLLVWIRAAHARGELTAELDPDWIFQMITALAMRANEEMQEGRVEQQQAGRLLGETLVRAFAG